MGLVWQVLLTFTEWLWKSVTMISLFWFTAAKWGPTEEKWSYYLVTIIWLSITHCLLDQKETSTHIFTDNTCKLFVSIATGSKLGDQFAVSLEDENTAGLVVHDDDVAVAVHRHTLRSHQLSWANFHLEKHSKSQESWHPFYNYCYIISPIYKTLGYKWRLAACCFAHCQLPVNENMHKDLTSCMSFGGIICLLNLPWISPHLRRCWPTCCHSQQWWYHRLGELQHLWVAAVALVTALELQNDF